MHDVHIVHVVIVWRLAGDAFTVIATTLKKGVAYRDSWSISPSLPLTSTTVADLSVACQGKYVSRAIVAGSFLVPDTTYTFCYAIVMRASGRTWAGSGSVAVTVGPEGSPTAADERPDTGS